MTWANISRRFTRRKTFGIEEKDTLDDDGAPQLAKVLTTFDLTLLGVGSTLGVGAYVVPGEVAKQIAGPAVFISFFIAAVASAFAAMCYAEFGARVPKAGSAYVYSYVTIGELVAFFIGWNLILEYLIGMASVARSFSGNINLLTNRTLSTAFEEYFPLSDGSFIAEYADILAFGATILATALLCFGMRSSATLNNCLTFVNIAVILFVIIAGSINADVKNWSIPKENITEPGDWGEGGFLPYGFVGVIKGAAKCFYAFVGFDSIAATGEEAKNPKKSIPFSINLTLIIAFLVYFGISVVLTLMVPYYEQDINAPLINAFYNIGWKWAGIIVGVGSCVGLAASLIGGMMPLPRILYAMGKDGVIFRFLARINSRFQTPMFATIISGSLAAVLTTIFNLETLIDMMSIGTILAYTLVAISVLVLRYEEMDHPDVTNESTVEVLQKKAKYPWNREPTRKTSKKAVYATSIFCLLALIVAGLGALLQNETDSEAMQWILFGLGLSGGPALMVLTYLALLPRSAARLYFKVPGVPLIPCLSIVINLFLMFSLSSGTWIRFAVWMAVGIVIYFGYGMWNSSEEYVSKGLQVPGSRVPVTKANGFGSQSSASRLSRVSIVSDFKQQITTDSHIEESPSTTENLRRSTATLDIDVHQKTEHEDVAENIVENIAEIVAENVDEYVAENVTVVENVTEKAQAISQQLKNDVEVDNMESEEKLAALVDRLLEADNNLKAIFATTNVPEPKVAESITSTTPPPTPMPDNLTLANLSAENAQSPPPVPPPIPSQFLFEETKDSASPVTKVPVNEPVNEPVNKPASKPDYMKELKDLLNEINSGTDNEIVKTLSPTIFRSVSRSPTAVPASFKFDTEMNQPDEE